MPATPQVQYKLEVTPTFRDLKGRFARAEKGLLSSYRGFLRDEGRRLVGFLEDEAPRSEEGEGFDGVHFADQIRFRTFVEGEHVGFKVSMPEPLATYILDGTRPHTISARSAKTLAFYWEAGPRGPDTYFYAEVRHPGTSPNRFVGRAVRRWFPGFRGGARKTALRYSRILQGKEKGGTL